MKLRGKVWLAVAFVALAALVFTGCPHNDVLYKSGGASGGGSRHDAGGNVQVVITNFANGGAPSRTIAPEHIDIKRKVAEYVFVATGTGGGTYGPAFIDVDGNTGVASLGIAGGGTWEITIEAYEIAKLGLGGDKQAIMAGAVTAVTGVPTALVLKGAATVDFSSGSKNVTLTLTNDGVGTEGDVNVSVDFKTPTDVNKINDQQGGGAARLKVTAALYNYVTGEIVTTALGSSEQEIHDGAGDIAPPVAYNVTGISKGRYQFRVTVSDVRDTPLAYWVDDIYVEGNRTTNGTADIYNLFNTPSDPTALKVYWNKRAATDLKDGFLAEFLWDGVSYNAVGIDMEIADITKWYKYDGGQHKVNFGDGDVTINANDALWGKIDTLAGGATATKEDVVTTLSWEDSPQSATAYPAIYKSGSLMNGSNGITFLMKTGHVYSVRIKAAGAQDDSGWYILGDTITPVTGIPTGTEFTNLQTQGLFDLIEVTYDLEGKYLLYRTGAGNAIGTKAGDNELVLHHEYDPLQAYSVDKKYNTDINTTNNGDWFLYPQLAAGGLPPAQVSDRITTWTGWQNKNNSRDTYLNSNGWNVAGYTGYSNLHLIPVGAGGSVGVQAETSGTFNVLSATKVLIAIETDETKTKDNAGWIDLATGDTNPGAGGGTDVKTNQLGLQSDGTRYILNLNRGGTSPTVLYVGVGDDATPDNFGILTDLNTNKFDVDQIEVALKKGLNGGVVFNVRQDSPVAYYKMDGVASGDYTLYVKILTSKGYWQTYQVPFVVKYDNQVIR